MDDTINNEVEEQKCYLYFARRSFQLPPTIHRDRLRGHACGTAPRSIF